MRRDSNNLMIIEGVPYSLVRETESLRYNPCNLCDLKTLCERPDGTHRFQILCTPSSYHGADYFKKDWSIMENQIKDYTNIFVDEV